VATVQVGWLRPISSSPEVCTVREAKGEGAIQVSASAATSFAMWVSPFAGLGLRDHDEVVRVG
jgi:hypothetical protein